MSKDGMYSLPLPSIGCLTSYRGGTLYWQSAPRRSISLENFEPLTPVELPSAFDSVPRFEAATAMWSPPTSPGARSRSGTFSRSPPHSPKADSAYVLDSPVMAPLTAKAQNQLADKLYAAACAGDLAHVRLLLSLGAPVNSSTLVKDLYDGFKPAKSGHLSPLAGAASHGQRDTVKLLLAHGATLNPTVAQSSSSPLHQACRANDIEMTRLLLALGADINALSCYRTTPLMYAAKQGSAELVRTVLQSQPNLHQTSCFSSAAIHWVIWSGHSKLAEMLLRAGADKNHALPDGSTPLHLAALYGGVETVQVLLRFGADLARRNEDWKTPLQVAEDNGRVHVVTVLKEALVRRATV